MVKNKRGNNSRLLIVLLILVAIIFLSKQKDYSGRFVRQYITHPVGYQSYCSCPVNSNEIALQDDCRNTCDVCTVISSNGVVYTRLCIPGAYCGNGVIDIGEECEVEADCYPSWTMMVCERCHCRIDPDYVSGSTTLPL